MTTKSERLLTKDSFPDVSVVCKRIHWCFRSARWGPYLMCGKEVYISLWVSSFLGINGVYQANLENILIVHRIHLQWDIILGLAVVLTQFRELEACPKKV